MNEYIIEKDVPFPKSINQCTRGLVGTVSKMEIGDSFVFDGKKSYVHQASGYCRRWDKIPKDSRFKTIKISETQIRVWRIA